MHVVKWFKLNFLTMAKKEEINIIYLFKYFVKTVMTTILKLKLYAYFLNLVLLGCELENFHKIYRFILESKFRNNLMTFFFSKS